jgi:beta-lactamase regulating signal transducer with metallopeptidase domain
MNTVVEQVNVVGKAFVNFSIPMLIQSSILIVVLLLFELFLRKRIRAVFRYCIWLLILVKLVMPPSISTPVGIGNLFGDKLTNVNLPKLEKEASDAVTIHAPLIESSQHQPYKEIEPVEKAAISLERQKEQTGIIETASIGVNIQPNSTASAVSFTWQGFLFLVWAIVLLILTLLLIQRAVFVNGLVRQAELITGGLNDLVQSCCIQLGIKGKIKLKASPNATSPAVCGLFRPVILLPQNLLSQLSKEQVKAVMFHELIHIRRGDLWVNLFQTLLQIIYFYNPFLWLANAVIRRVREQAVDEAVQVALGEEAETYPQILVEVAKMAFKRPALSLRLVGVVESKSALKSRISRMLSRPIPKSAKLGIAGLLAIIIIGVVLLPMAAASNKPDSKVTKEKMQSYVEDFFKHNYRDITARKTIEWGEPVIDPNGNQSIRYKYEATIWDKDKVVNDEIFTFDKNGKFVSVKKIRSHPEGTKEWMQELVKEFFKNNYRDVTARKTIEWGEPTTDEKGNYSIRYKYEATIWDRDKIIDNKIFTFDKEGKFISVKNAEGFPKKVDESFKATLTNGVTVELVGVCDYPEGKPRIWQPDGLTSVKEIYVKRERDYSNGKYGFILKVDGPEDLSFVWNRIEGSSNLWGSCTVIDSKGDKLDGFQAAITNDFDSDTTSIQIGISTDTWQTIATHTGKSITTSGNKNILFSQAYESDGFSAITVSSPWRKDQVERIVAVDKSGQIHMAKNIDSVASGEIDQMTAKFHGLKLEDITEFRLQTRPYQWVTFKNVSLKPGNKTDVQVEVEKPVIQAKGESRTDESIGRITSGTGAKGKITAQYGDAIFGSKVKYTPILYLGWAGKGDELELVDDRVAFNQFGVPIVKIKIVSESNSVSKDTIGWIILSNTSFSDSFEPKPDAELPESYKKLQQKTKEEAIELLKFSQGPGAFDGKGKVAYLPDIDKVPCMLDLTSGELIKLVETTSRDDKQRRFTSDKPGRGDLIYGYSGGKAYLASVEGSIVRSSSGKFTEFIKSYKQITTFTLAELPKEFQLRIRGRNYNVRVLGDENGCYLEYHVLSDINPDVQIEAQNPAGQGEKESGAAEQLSGRADEDIAIFNSYFPDDKSAGERLDKLFDLWSKQGADSNALSLTDQQILEVVRNGFRRTDRHPTLILGLVGNRYIWGKSPQNEDAVDLMYRASYSPDSNIRHYAEYFGLSVVERKSPEILKRLAQLCANYKETDTGRIIWGVKRSNQVDEFIKLLQTYLNSSDPEIRKRAETVIKELEGKPAGQGGVENKAAEQLKSKADESLPAKNDLQNMINSAKVGETIIMPKGVFSAPISINKSLTLKGEDANNCIIEVTANQPAVFIDTKGKGKVSIGNLTIKWQLATGDKNIENPFAVLVKDSKADFNNCTFLPLGNYQRSPVALRAAGFTNMTVNDCRFEGYGYTVQFGEGTSGTIQDSIVTKSGHQGISLYEGANVKIIGNIVAGSLYHGIRSTGGRLDARDNLIINNSRGVYLGNKDATGVITNNVIMGNPEGICGFANSQVMIANNVFAGSTYAGVDMRNSCRLSIRDNIFQNNETGLKLFKEAGGDNNKVYKNTFWENKTVVDGFEIIPVFIEAAPQFTDANNGDFSLKSGPVQEQKQGLTNPEVFKNLWRKWQKIKSENTDEKDFNQTNED